MMITCSSSRLCPEHFYLISWVWKWDMAEPGILEERDGKWKGYTCLRDGTNWDTPLIPESYMFLGAANKWSLYLSGFSHLKISTGWSQMFQTQYSQYFGTQHCYEKHMWFKCQCLWEVLGPERTQFIENQFCLNSAYIIPSQYCLLCLK